MKTGLPLPRGSVNRDDTFSIFDSDNRRVSYVVTPGAYWPDNSIKWCLVKLAILADKPGTATVRVLVNGPGKNESGMGESEKETSPLAPLKINSSDTIISIRESGAGSTNSSIEFNFDRTGQFVFPEVKINDQRLWAFGDNYPGFHDADGTACTFDIDTVSIEEQDAISCVCIVRGKITGEAAHTVNVKFRFEVFAGGKLRCGCEIHNPQRAMHPGGIWDLGDPGSVFFEDFSINLTHDKETSFKIKLEPEADWIEAEPDLVLFQASSGGTHWNSPVHVNASGKVSNEFSGYKLSSNGSVVHEGSHATPVLLASKNNHQQYSVIVDNFWQNFPKSIDIDSSNIQLRVFPKHHGDLHELQGGERKNHDILFCFLQDTHPNPVAAEQPYAELAPQIYTDSGVFRYFDHEVTHQQYEQLISKSLHPDTGFFAKREQLDEYGWRNFGEVYADHETAHHKEDTLFVSHYNNQYDPIMGFAKQYALTGDRAWFILMHDLAVHVMDIDIYRTGEDRIEYNNGLFWHTDHYAQAYTASHRTFSSKQIDEHGNKTAGGGPGPQHCYSTGLVHYYYLTGCEEAKSTVYELGEWVHNYYTGSGTLLETAKKTLQEDAKNFVSTCKGNQIFKYTYPMDRGTGNYLRTMMDCYELSSNANYMDLVETIIRNTAGPSDDIDARGFDDIDGTWFYIIYLQEVIRYLDIKRELGEYDSAFYYARATLLHYARWMADNELPYLSHAEKLVYPNATWVAQDIRKSNVLYAAYLYALQDRTPFLEKARYFRDYVTEELSQSYTLHYARIQILLLQNHGPAGFLEMETLPLPGISEEKISTGILIDQKHNFHTPASYFKYMATTWVSCLAKFRFKNELRWIKSRTG